MLTCSHELRWPCDGQAKDTPEKHAWRLSNGGYKRPAHPKKSRKTATQGTTTSNRAISEEPASDGKSALRDVQSKEARTHAPGLNGTRGLKNRTLPHWHEPKAIIGPKGKRWEFSCKYCDTYIFKQD